MSKRKSSRKDKLSLFPHGAAQTDVIPAFKKYRHETLALHGVNVFHQSTKLFSPQERGSQKNWDGLPKQTPYMTCLLWDRKSLIVPNLLMTFVCLKTDQLMCEFLSNASWELISLALFYFFGSQLDCLNGNFAKQ
jgi:hypothetical protein